MKETRLWKYSAALIAAILVVFVSANAVNPDTVPPEITSFLFGLLISIAVGYTVVSRRSSPVILSSQQESTVRKQQYIVGMVFSVLLASMFLFPDFRASPSSWMLVPFIFLGPALVVREWVMRRHDGNQ